MKELFEGNEHLFQGLAIHNKWDWTKQHPVVHINFSGGVHDVESLHLHIKNILQDNATRLGVPYADSGSDDVDFHRLISDVEKHYGEQVVILVDEYDKPLLDNITDDSAVRAIRKQLIAFYSVIKAQEASVRFAFLTGISQFSKVSIFSGLNNLDDITLDARYGSICGYTQTEVEHYFAPYIKHSKMEEIQAWYNGYNWLGDKVYNPYDILLFIDKGETFRPYWFETGTPGFLIELLKKKYYHVPTFEKLEVSHQKLKAFDVDNLDLEAILFQSGYLTIKSVDATFKKPTYMLGFPNLEVQSSFTEMLLTNYLQVDPVKTSSVAHALAQGDMDALEQHVSALFNGIANDNYRNNTIADYEGYYASVLYAFFSSLGFATQAEDVTNKGRIDLVVTVPTAEKTIVYIFGFKVIDDSSQVTNKAVSQIKDKGYGEKYCLPGNEVVFVGITFNKSVRAVASFLHEKASS